MDKKYYVAYKDFKDKQDMRWVNVYTTDSTLDFIWNLFKLRNYKTMDIRIRRFKKKED